jgi:hypothetical protein
MIHELLQVILLIPLISGPLCVLKKVAYIITLRNDYKKIMANHLSKVKGIIKDICKLLSTCT